MPLLRKDKGGIFGFGILPLKRPLKGSSSSPEVPYFKDRTWEELEMKKRKEWTARGYSESLQRMAIELAHDYAVGISGWIATITTMPREEVEKKLYEYSLETVAEKWITEMAK